MAVPRKLIVAPSAATRELWRISDSGEMDDLEAVLSRADINARNEHGMTALMRAARHGRLRLVSVLLEHGADPNVTRNDNFTALSLAAFFGHAEVVDILMRHGAKTDVATRFGTSPQIWAKARSYGDVARTLQTHTDPPKQSVSSVVPPVVVSEPERVVIRTLKEPPEIWDLVQEAPRDFKATSNFMARVGRLNGALTITIVALLLIGAGVAAAFYFRNKLPARLSSMPAPATAAATVPAPVVNQTPDATTNIMPEAPVVATQPTIVEPPTTTPINHRSRPFARARAIPNAAADTPQPNIETATAPPVVAPPKAELRTSPEAETKKPAPPVSSQMVTPQKTSQPKGKVIQWP
jgi:hypothetical protein